MSDVVVVAVIAAIPGTLGVVVGWRNKGKIDTIHVLVNQRMTDAVARIDQLTQVIEGSDSDLPDDPADPYRAGK